MNNFNPNYVSYGVDPYAMGGQQYPTVAKAKFSQPLTEQDMAELQAKVDKFSLALDPLDVKRSYCTHKRGQEIVLKQNDDGSFTCAVCGETFNLVEANAATIEEHVKAIKDILQSIKTYYLDIPEESTMEFFPIIPLLDKVPKFYEQAVNNFNKYNGAGFNMNTDPYRQTWPLYTSIVGPTAAAPVAGYQMPYGMPQQAAPQMVPSYGMPQQPFNMAPTAAPGVSPFFANTAPAPAPVAVPAMPQASTAMPVNSVAPAADATANGGEQIINTKTYNV